MKAKTIPSPNAFREDLSPLTEEQYSKVLWVLKNFMREVREIERQASERTRHACPEKAGQCASCAFNPETDREFGFAPTAYGLLVSILLPEKLFLCHANQPHWKENVLLPDRLKLCEGFASVVVVDHEKARACARRAIEAIAEIVPKIRPLLEPQPA